MKKREEIIEFITMKHILFPKMMEQYDSMYKVFNSYIKFLDKELEADEDIKTACCTICYLDGKFIGLAENLIYVTNKRLIIGSFRRYIFKSDKYFKDWKLQDIKYLASAKPQLKKEDRDENERYLKHWGLNKCISLSTQDGQLDIYMDKTMSMKYFIEQLEDCLKEA